MINLALKSPLRFVFLGCLFPLLVCSCNNASTSTDHLKVKPEIDTLEYLPEHFYCSEDKHVNIARFCPKFRDIRKKGIPKNEPVMIYLHSTFCNPAFEKIFRNSNVELTTTQKRCRLTRLSKYKYQVDLDSNFNEMYFTVKYVIQPRKNIIIKMNISNEYIKYPQKYELLIKTIPVQSE